MVVLVGKLLATPALGAETIKSRIDVHDLRIVVNYVLTGELAKLAAKHGDWVDTRDIRQTSRHGYSILRKDAAGTMTCEIYLPSDLRPRRVDDEGTLTLGHEVLHCMLGDYHR